ncbi:ribonuclease domain-containing protein [Xenophilus sp. Marseille-Q4582]|uniref:ribonuclease domain-containing protein n=1 Tax=Xenophilus sp. Marseille-Q4582 TaxID=2866600 RepID=UPI001CE3D1F9|nr:ribonuclease domain-containing protein [Xenophilus sp. Marseille-Q4582]
MAAPAPLFTSASRFASKFVLTGAVLAALWGGGEAGWARESREARPSDGADRVENVIALRDLPAQGRRTYQLILDGGPFRYDKDGSVFGNRERLLPRERRGHYREYTVDTPGARNRGARRIVCGGPPRTPEACWYTADHYASFKRILP